MLKYAVPCVISMLVATLYNIVYQIFIANTNYLGSYGNAANTVVFSLTIVTIALAVMIGDGCCTFVSLVLTIIYLVFQEPILTAFGAAGFLQKNILIRIICFSSFIHIGR